MSFSADARRVRDPGLPLAWRHTALRCAVTCYRPMGYRATWAFLETAGDLRRDQDALLRALERLELSSAAWLAEEAAFAVLRREEKRGRHRRSPTAAQWLRHRGYRWPGPEGHAAMLGEVGRLWAPHAGPFPSVPAAEKADLVELDATVAGCVSSYLGAGGALDAGRAALLWRVLPRLRGTTARWGLEPQRAAAYACFRRLGWMAELMLNDRWLQTAGGAGAATTCVGAGRVSGAGPYRPSASMPRERR
ncbi:hypothetical protein [Streptacidiphilus neutrinimicus]|uniref:hypothetical protein n=1 Tax=Streptacidiphilus neutrinimicus TaxID=105420 RepID=UPI000693575F|nr:hypothetical protein [Streptacidiphilus neutrinimicus]